MQTKRFLRAVLVAAATLSVAVLGPVAQAAPTGGGQAATPGDGAVEAITVAELAAAAQQGKAMSHPRGGWDVPSNRSYHLLPSCDPYAAAIRQGASVWEGLNETAYSGTPVECRDTYIYDCGQGRYIVGCNWGYGDRIALYMGGVRADALLAAHEFGHDWYGHSGYRCAGWSSPAHVMAPRICNYTAGITKESTRID